MKNSFKDDNASVIEKFKSVSFDYQKNGDVVSFEQQKFNSKLTPTGDIIATGLVFFILFCQFIIIRYHFIYIMYIIQICSIYSGNNVTWRNKF